MSDDDVKDEAGERYARQLHIVLLACEIRKTELKLDELEQRLYALLDEHMRVSGALIDAK